MKKVILSLVLLTGFVFAKAQTGNNQIGVAAEVGLPIGDFGNAAKTGFGGYVKGLYGVGTAGQITVTVGYSSFKGKDDVGGGTWGVLPFLAGYRHSFSGFYLEPQVGFGSYKYKISGESASTSAFTYALGAGYAMNGLDLGIRYQNATKDGGNFSLIGLHVGYNFSLGGSSSKK